MFKIVIVLIVTFEHSIIHRLGIRYIIIIICANNHGFIRYVQHFNTSSCIHHTDDTGCTLRRRKKVSTQQGFIIKLPAWAIFNWNKFGIPVHLNV